MDSDFETTSMSLEFSECLLNAGVRQHVLDKLTEDELCTVELIDSASDVLLKECGIKAGQIVKLRLAIQGYKNEVTSVLEYSPPSTPRSSVSRIDVTNSPATSLQIVRASTPLLKASSPLSSSNQSSLSSDMVPSFSGSEVSTDNIKWIQNFQLPSKFSKEVTNALETKTMGSRVRNEFTRDICSSIRAHTFYPTKTEREHVALMIIKKYPFLADKLGSGIGSWEQAIKNHLKNKRKAKLTGVKRSMPKTNQPELKAKKVKTMDIVGKLPEMQEGETKETCKEHVSMMKKEMMKSTNRRMAIIKELMEVTFPYRRQAILLEPTEIDSVIQDYPALGLVSELKAEFGRVMGDRNVGKSMVDKFKATWLEKVLKLAKEKSCSKALMEEMDEAISSDNANSSGIKENVALMVLPILMKERATMSDLLKVCGDDESIDDAIAESVAPRLVGAGDIGEVKPLYIAGESKIIVKLNNSTTMLNALVLLVGCYYIFNIEYPASTRNIFLFLEAAMLEKTSEVKKRVAINKFFQELK